MAAGNLLALLDDIATIMDDVAVLTKVAARKTAVMLGGASLCYEEFEKLAHKILHSRKEDAAHHAELVRALADPAVDIVAFEKEKIKGAIRTDFILSAEIIAITLGI